MNLLRVTSFYHRYVIDFYNKHLGLGDKSFDEQKAALDYDAFGWADYWSYALTPLGYHVMEVVTNVEPLQRAWARENSLSDPAGIDIKQITLAQAKKFKPEILLFEDGNEDLLKQIRSEVPSLRLVIGWVGSAITQENVLQHVDLVLSCAPESVEYLKKAGYSTKQLHHGFDPRINNRLREMPKYIDFSFVGQLIQDTLFHLHRVYLLEQIVSQIPLEIFSPSANIDWKDYIKTLLKIAVYESVKATMAIGFPESVLKSFPIVREATRWTSRPILPVNKKLRPFMKPSVFGLDMFQVLRNSKITLNIHADSSFFYASNMRLFEATGVGTCLLTDWKVNLHELFEPDKEVVVYKSADECVEKVKWLLRYPKKLEEIAFAGQTRTMKDHTYAQRGWQFDEIIKKALRQKTKDFKCDL